MAKRRVSRLIALLIMGGVATGLVAACSSDSSSPSSAPLVVKGDGGGGGRAEMPAQPTPKDAPAPNNPQQRQVDQPGVDRKLVRTATLELAAANGAKVAEVADGARTIAVDLNGFAGQEEVKGESASITLHVPSNQFDKALAQLTDLVPPEGFVSRSQTADDVTEQLVDLDSRIATQRASVDRVRALLARAGTVSEIVQIEGEVTRREADLESLQKRRETLSGQVALSKVTVRVSKAGTAPAPPPKQEDDGGFLSGLAGGWDAFLTAGTVLLRVLGALLPFLIALGVPAWFALRWWLRRRKTLGTAPATSQ